MRQKTDSGTIASNQIILAGRELDAMVAEKVMGWRWIEAPGHDRDEHPGEWVFLMPPEQVDQFLSRFIRSAEPRRAYRYDLPFYSTDIAAAFPLVSKINKLGMWLKLTSPFNPSDVWNAGFTAHNSTGWNGMSDFRGQGESAPEAICRAALAVVETISANANAAAIITERGMQRLPGWPHEGG